MCSLRTVLALVLGTATLLACRTSGTPPRAQGDEGVRVYVSNEDSGDVLVIDGDADRALHTIPVGRRPRGLRLGPDGRALFVAVRGGGYSPTAT